MPSIFSTSHVQLLILKSRVRMITSINVVTFESVMVRSAAGSWYICVICELLENSSGDSGTSHGLYHTLCSHRSCGHYSLQPATSSSSHITDPEQNLTSLSFLDPDDWWSSLMINFAVIVNANVLDRSCWLGTRSKHKQASYSIGHLLIHNLGRL